MLRAYVATFAVVVAQWERGDFEAVRPYKFCPLTTSICYNKWSGAAAQERLQELIGMVGTDTKYNTDGGAFYSGSEHARSDST